jgi:hypothetical protein
MPAGRDADIKMLKERLRSARNPEEHNLAAHKLQQVLRQLEDSKLNDLRANLIKAERTGTSKQADAVREAIQAHMA